MKRVGSPKSTPGTALRRAGFTQLYEGAGKGETRRR
jgi:hypothetical protein